MEAVLGGVYCLGDGACVEGMDLPANAQVALQQSDYLAWNIWAGITGRQPLDFKYINLGEMMTLGGATGAVSALGGRLQLTGPAAALARRAVYANAHRAAEVASSSQCCRRDSPEPGC
ncbi:unnamed protein product [Discosporangium mesarthrocarpum]